MQGLRPTRRTAAPRRPDAACVSPHAHARSPRSTRPRRNGSTGRHRLHVPRCAGHALLDCAARTVRTMPTTPACWRCAYATSAHASRTVVAETAAPGGVPLIRVEYDIPARFRPRARPPSRRRGRSIPIAPGDRWRMPPRRDPLHPRRVRRRRRRPRRPARPPSAASRAPPARATRSSRPSGSIGWLQRRRLVIRTRPPGPVPHPRHTVPRVRGPAPIASGVHGQGRSGFGGGEMYAEDLVTLAVLRHGQAGRL